ncbi:MAG: NAD(+)/NADH kinase [Candidatus Hydrothermales bacterium]
MKYEIKRILVVFNPKKENVKSVIKRIEKFFKGKDIEIEYTSEPEKLGHKGFDLVITLGGDGTLLRAVHCFPDSIFLGVHLGKVGFLCDVKGEDLELYLNETLKNNFHILERETVYIKWDSEKHFALNDLLIRNEPAGRIMEFDLYIENVKFFYSADGVLICTPTGSTAYNLALNGPILYYDLKGFCINVIAPFNVNSRPIVVPSGKKIYIIPKGKTNIPKLWVDGQKEYILPLNKKILISSGERRIKFISFKDKGKSIYKRLKEKFNF